MSTIQVRVDEELKKSAPRFMLFIIDGYVDLASDATPPTLQYPSELPGSKSCGSLRGNSAHQNKDPHCDHDRGMGDDQEFSS